MGPAESAVVGVRPCRVVAVAEPAEVGPVVSSWGEWSESVEVVDVGGGPVAARPLAAWVFGEVGGASVLPSGVVAAGGGVGACAVGGAALFVAVLGAERAAGFGVVGAAWDAAWSGEWWAGHQVAPRGDLVVAGGSGFVSGCWRVAARRAMRRRAALVRGRV